MPSPQRRTLLAVGIACTATALTVTTAAASPGDPARPGATTSAHIVGKGRMYYAQPGNDIEVTVDAHATFTGGNSFPAHSWGTLRIYHRMDQGAGKPPLVNWGDLTVDCVTAGGPSATVTGILKDSGPFWKTLIGHRMGVSFYVPGPHQGPSRIGLSGAPTLMGWGELTKCMAPAAQAPIISGAYHLHTN